ncbi:MAG: hypothetical protein JWL77_4271 [Chthonomonadaceae bacterium]|nr:hypothetical protein [Chthonomonadaceae bacterium]
MKLKPLFAIAGLTAALSLSLVVTSADAQGRRGGRNGGAAGAGGGAGVGATAVGGGGFMTPQQMQMMMGGMGNIIDPAKSAKMTLIYRTDVQNGLNLDLKQKLALDGLKDVQAQDQQKMGQDMRTLFQSARGQAQTATPEERQKQMQDIADKVQGISQGYQDDLEKRVDAILTPRQRKRLTEIDLRWRGPLSLVDPKVAEKAALGADDKKKVTDAYKEFTDARQKLMDSMMPTGFRNRNGNNIAAAVGAAPANGAATSAAAVNPNAAPATPAQPLTPEEQQAARQKALRDFEKSRVAMGVKLVANVTPPVATTWQDMIGAPFTFRDDILP